MILPTGEKPRASSYARVRPISALCPICRTCTLTDGLEEERAGACLWLDNHRMLLRVIVPVHRACAIRLVFEPETLKPQILEHVTRWAGMGWLEAVAPSQVVE